VILERSSVKKATSNSSLKAMSLKLVKESTKERLVAVKHLTDCHVPRPQLK
jgi:hypothetical protein